MNRRLGLLCATTTLLVIPGVAIAQTAPTGALQPGQLGTDFAAPGVQRPTKAQPKIAPPDTGEIIVTANRREQRLQDVPLSVTAVSGETIRERGIENPEDLSRVAPSLVSQNNAANAQGTNFAIRGVGTASFQRSIEPSVAIVLDDVTLIRSELGVINFTDLAQVEVLQRATRFPVRKERVCWRDQHPHE